MQASTQLSGYAAMGHPIGTDRRTKALALVREIAPDYLTEQATGCVNRVAEQLERDQIYEAQRVGMEYLDLTGTYRLFAVLLAG